MKIRRMEQKDCFSVAHVVTIAWNETYRGIVNDEFLDNLYKNEEERGKKSFENFDGDNQFVLEVDGEVVGFITVDVIDSSNKQGEICSVYIIKKYKGKGFGRKLIDTGINELKSLGCSNMIIGCLDGNPSNEFYKHIGGKFINTRIYKLPNQELVENVYYYDSI